MYKGLKFFYITLFFNLIVNYNFSQKKEPAYLRFYRNGKMLCNSFNFNIQLNKIDVHTLKPAISKIQALEYQMFSEGRINVSVSNWMNDWNSTTVLNVEAGKTYYVKIDCTISGIYLSTNQTMGEKEWVHASKNYLESVAEDPKKPIVEQTEIELSAPVRTDTIKKIVYVNSYQSNKYVYQPFADIDFNIPSDQPINESAYALIIGNEDYVSFQPDLKSEMNVDFARNDASAFKEYAGKSLGIPEKNITVILDGTYGQINQAISRMNLIAKNTGGKGQFVFYYAGHGMPDEVTKEPYLIPVDISGSNISSAIKLKDVYTKLTEFPSEKVLVFLDACFTGGARGEGLVAGRGISIKPKEELLKGNIVVFSSSSGSQSSLSYPDKKHGVYSYFLLKKLQESKADITLKDLSDYLKEKVSLETIIINNKEQNPQINYSSSISDKWVKWKLAK